MSEASQDAPGTLMTGPSGVPAQGASTRWRHGHHKLRALVAAGAIVAAAAGVMIALPAGSPSDPPSALAALTGALAKTSAESYSFSLDSTTKFKGKELNSDAVSGAFDPKHEQGKELLTARETQPSANQQKAQIRFTGKYVYTSATPRSGLGRPGKPWDKSPLPASGADVLSTDDLYGFVTDWPVSPDELLAVVRSTAKVRDSGPVSGPGWTGIRYTFTSRLSPRWFVSGTVYVDERGRVRSLVTTTTRKGGFTTYRELTFGDFGVPVPVTPPPSSQVQYTSTPYWGFYF